MATAKQIVVKIGSDITGFDKGIQQVNQKIDQMQKDTRNKYGAIADSMGGFGRSMTLGVTLPVVAAGAAMLNSTLNMDRLKAAMEATEGSAGKAAKTMRELQKVAEQPGIGYREAVQAYVQLKNASIAGKDAIKVMEGFAKAVARGGGGKEELARVIWQIQQMAGVGKVLNDDLKVIRSNAPAVAEAMQKIYGTTNTEELAKNGISAKQFITDISNHLIKLKGTTGGVRNDIENELDKLDRALAKTGENAIPAIQDLLKAGDWMLEAWNKVPEPVQKTALKLGLVAAATGPLVTGTGNLIKTYGWLKTAQAAIVAWQTRRISSTIAETTATVASTTATTANTAAVSANIVARQAATASTTALAIATSASATSAGVATTAWAGLAAALSSVAGVAALAGAAVAAPLLIGSHLLGKQAKAAQDSINKQRNVEQDLFKKTYDKHTTEQLERDLKRQEELRAQAIERRKAYDESSWWNKWQPGAKADRNEAEYQYKTANERVLWLKETIAARKEENRTQAELSEEARKAIAEHEKRNREAIQEKHILSQSNEYERDKAKAWVDFVRAKDDIKERAEDVKQKTGVVLDISTQIYAAEYEYKQKLAEINKEQQAALKEQENLEGLAGLELQAIQTSNEYAKQRVYAQSHYHQSLQDLELLEKKGYDVSQRRAQAKAEYTKSLADIAKSEKAEADSELASERMAGLKEKAIKDGNEAAVQKINAYSELYDKFVSLAKIAEKGYAVANRAKEAVAQYWAKIKDIDKVEAEKAKEAAKASNQRIFADWKQIIEDKAKQYEIMTAGGPDEDTGKLKALSLRRQAELEELKRARAEAMELPTDEQDMRIKQIDERVKLVNLKYSKDNEEIQTGGLKAIADKVRELKDQEIEAWEERINAAKRYFDFLMSGYSITTLEGAREKALSIGLEMTASKAMPVLPPRPDENNITSMDVRAALQEIARSAQEQKRFLEQIADYQRELVQPA